MKVKQFVILDEDGNDVPNTTIDPYISHVKVGNEISVDNSFFTYDFTLKEGQRYVIRDLEEN